MSPAAALLWAMSVSTERSVEAAVGGRFETLVGVVPDTSFVDARASVAFAVVPVAGLEIQRDRYELAVLYRPRAYWRFPNPVDMSRPLLLHQAALTHRLDLTTRTSWNNHFDGSIGEVDYTLASIVFDPTQPTVPNDSVTKLVRFNASTGLGHQLTHRASTGLTLAASYSAPLDRTENPTYFTSLGASAEPFYRYVLGGRDQAALAAGVGYAWFQDASNYLFVTPNLTWTHTFNRQTEGSIAGGVAYVHALDSSELSDTEAGDTDVTPTAEVELRSRAYGERGFYVDAGGTAEYRWFLDPILGRPVRRAGGGLFAQVELPPDWTAGAAVSFFTTVGESAFEPLDETRFVRRDGTMLRIDAPVTYRLSDLLGLEFGVRSNLRGPPVSEGLDFDRVELWFYGALRVVFDPKDRESGWAR